MSFDWDDLRYFLSVARAGRLTAAAPRMGTDHATVSRRVRALEERLGAALFTRSPRGYTLTDMDERLLRYAEEMESTSAKIQNDIAGERLSLSGAVRIGAPDGFGAFFLAPRIGELARRNPELDLQIVAMPRIFSLSKREADIAISLSRPERGRLVSRKLTDYSLHVYASRHYLERHPAITGRDDFSDHLLIGYISELIFAPELDYITHIGEKLSPRLSSTNLFAQLRATMAGTGLCILPDFMTSGNSDLVRVLPEEIELKRTFWLTVHEDVRESARVRTAIRFIVSAVEEARGEFMNFHGSVEE
ncbi:LysR family transcriptional regulator [Rhizobium sp. L1K21]|uniref:LysR family transcriptional regulator n=1 Tax=Rhizobium sp. L1K21 TaxID=2954933 RepID=UPI002093AB07|nr:LysR family transcriptional regulator [Rhizobium sp. L1K21]MCO6187628.1 LysR family transcriptional regulator [Rhizobium sp. L1K21]